MAYGEVMVELNLIWEDIIAESYSTIEDVPEQLWQYASVPADLLQALHLEQLEAMGRVLSDGRIYMTPEPKDIILFVCGGTGGLHATVFHSFGSCLTQTQPLAEIVNTAG